MTTTTVATDRLQSPPAARLLRRVGLDTQYVLLGFPLGIFSTVVLTTGFATGLGMIVIWVGIPILFATLLMLLVYPHDSVVGALRQRLESGGVSSHLGD